MPNRRLTTTQLNLANQLLIQVRAMLHEISKNDLELLWAYRRKIYKELTYDERGTPAERKRLKAEKRIEQNGLCTYCGKNLPSDYVHLHRIEAMEGYTTANTQLIHDLCHVDIQRQRNYA